MARRFTLVGPGRAGRSISAALSELGWELIETYGRRDDPQHAARDVELCVIATPDSEIERTASRIDVGDATVMHLSGATPLSALAPHVGAGLHPLVSLADATLGARSLRSAWFAVAGEPVAREIAQALSGRWFELGDDDRDLYHAAAVVGSNHLVALLGQVERVAAEVGVPLEAFLALAMSSIENTAELGPADALTGPAARGDDETIQRHRAALLGRLPDELAAYDAMLELAKRLVTERDGRAD